MNLILKVVFFLPVEGYRLNQQIDRPLSKDGAHDDQPRSGFIFTEADESLLHRLSFALEHGNRPAQSKWWLLSRCLIVVTFAGTRGCLYRGEWHVHFIPGAQEPRWSGVPFQLHSDEIRQDQCPLLWAPHNFNNLPVNAIDLLHFRPQVVRKYDNSMVRALGVFSLSFCREALREFDLSYPLAERCENETIFLSGKQFTTSFIFILQYFIQ